MSERIQTGAIEPIVVMATNASGIPVTGKSDLKVSVRRQSDGKYLDWSDMTFKSSGIVDLYQLLAEVNPTKSPGEYQYQFDTMTIANPVLNDTYEIRSDQIGGTDVKNMPQIGELKIGQYVDLLDVSVSSRASPADVRAQANLALADYGTAKDYKLDNVLSQLAIMAPQLTLIYKIEKNRWAIVGTQLIYYEDDGTTPLLVFNLKNQFGDPTATEVFDKIPV